ncbi:flavoprotein-like protein, partial [Thamnidium elegans]
MPTVYIIIYSLYHHIYTVALDVKKGLEAQGVTVKLFQVPETLSDNILEVLHAPPKPDIPVITIDELSNADAFMFGIPTRFGTFPAQLKSFLDASGALWATGTLAGKFAGTFFSTASQHGGQETTAYTLITYFAHHGINYVPLGFADSNLFDNSEVIGGSAWGAGTVANGDGSRQPSEKELTIARTQGENFAKILNTFHQGVKLIESEKEVEATNAAEPVKTAEPVKAAEPIKVAEPEPKQTPRSSQPKLEEKKDSKCFCM